MWHFESSFLIFFKENSLISITNFISRSQHVLEMYRLIKLYRYCHLKYFFRSEVEEVKDNVSLGACDVKKP